MKIHSSLRRLAIFSSLMLPASLQAIEVHELSTQTLEVHEWGTFTVLVDANGTAVNWYQPNSDIAQLPSFTHHLASFKPSMAASRVRMETPVIYFYPKKEMNVQARVAFFDGQITERFPSANDNPFESSNSINPFRGASTNLSYLTPSYVPPKTSNQIFDEKLSEAISGSRPIVTQWSGKLLPPDHADAKLIPSVAGHKGENYGAAREVPDAWIFHSDQPTLQVQDQEKIHPVEKFIFYRGVGQSVPNYRVSMPYDQKVSFANFGIEDSSFQVALSVKENQARWIQIPAVTGLVDSSRNTSEVTFPEKWISLEQADKELSALFLTELKSRGLTEAEAKAMIKTWNHTWFNEPGHRVFTIVDRKWVDETLPLAISPSPEKIERVFVARYEIISPETEQKLAAILSADPKSEQTIKDYKSLQLGRFGNGAAEIVAEREKSKALGRLNEIHHQSMIAKPR